MEKSATNHTQTVVHNLKKIIIISIFTFLFSCKEKEQKAISDFSENDAYEIINLHLIGQLKENELDSIVYWNNRQLVSPEYEHTKIWSDELLNFKRMQPPNPIFTKEYWKTERLNGLKIVEWKDYDYFFKKNDSIDLEKLWDSKFQNKNIHNISYPIYNDKTKIAVIEDFEFHPFLLCGTGLDNFYYYKKTAEGWKKQR